MTRPSRNSDRRGRAVRDRFAPAAPIWLTETGGAACGGLRWQPAFLDVFRFVDTHGRLARQGLDAIFTHALISGSNGVIDETTFEPNASYWSALLWKRLVGAKVLDAGPQRPQLHLYAHCQRGVPGGVTLIALNLAGSPQTLQIAREAQIFALTSPDLQSTTVLLNGRQLKLRRDGTMPAIAPLPLGNDQAVVAAKSVNFITSPQAQNVACSDHEGVAK